MRTWLPLLSLLLLSSAPSWAAGERTILPPSVKSPPRSHRLFCKTGSEFRSATQPLELYLQYFLPIVFEPEDPTMPYARQVLVLSGRPMVQIKFKKASEPAGESGEKLEPMTCAFAKRTVSQGEPSQVQVFLPSGQPHWISQSIGQRTGPKQLSFERAVMAPAGDWAFASQFEKVFYVDLDDAKNFVTTQVPRPL